MPSLVGFFDIGEASMKRKIIGGVAAGVTALCVIFLFSYMFGGSGSSRNRSDQVYFYDLGTGKLVELEFNTAEHIAGFIGESSGKPMALAFVYDCDECSEATRWVGHLEIYNAEALAIMKQRFGQDIEDEATLKKLQDGNLVGRPEDRDDLSK